MPNVFPFSFSARLAKRVRCAANGNGFKITTSRTDWRDEMGVRPVGVTLGSLSKYFPQQQIEAILHASGR
ncbi:MAG TPA: hypothetical protein VI670_09985, partial [Thermoanaerobaculia bacterium]